MTVCPRNSDLYGNRISFHDISYKVDLRTWPWAKPTKRIVLDKVSGFFIPGLNAILGPTGSGKTSLANAGRTIVLSIHQPRYSIYRLFDRLTLITQGQIVYQGPAGDEALVYFDQVGYSIEGHDNPADFLIDILHGEVPCSREIQPTNDDEDSGSNHSGIDCQRKNIVSQLLSHWYNSNLFKSNQSNLAGQFNLTPPTGPTSPLVNQISCPSGDSDVMPIADQSVIDHCPDKSPMSAKVELIASSATGKADAALIDVKASDNYSSTFCQQLAALVRRNMLCHVRDLHSLAVHFLVQLFICLILGLIYLKLPTTPTSGIQNRLGLFFFLSIQLLYVNSSLLDLFANERVIFIHKSASGFYRTSAYFLSKVVCDVLLIKSLPALICLPLTYLMTGLKLDAIAFLYFQLTLCLLVIAGSGIAMAVASFVTKAELGGMVLSICYVTMMMTSGIVININSLAVWLRWLRSVSIVRLSLNSLLFNELSGRKFCPLSQSDLAASACSSNSTTTNCPNVSLENGRNVTTKQSCLSGEYFLALQDIDHDASTKLNLWVNHLGIIGVLIVSLLIAYIGLRCVNKYR